MNKIRFLVILGALLSTQLKAQLTIEYCQQKAIQNYPLIEQYGLIHKTSEYTLANASKAYLPQFSIFARATYQSNVTSLPGEVVSMADMVSKLPNMPDFSVPEKGRLMNKDQYNVNAGVNQVIWDGGIVRAKRKITKATTEVENKNVEVQLYGINERVNNLFFGILLLDKQLAQLDLYGQVLQSNYDQIKGYVDNGLATESDLDLVQATYLANEQNKEKARGTRKAFSEMLSILINEPVNELIVPDKEQFVELNSVVKRPELQLFDAKEKMYNAQKSAINAENLPRIGLFAQVGYGNPNLNLLDNRWNTYFIGGVGMVWNFGNLYSRGNSMKKIKLAKQINANLRDTFLFNTNLTLTQEKNEIEKKRNLIVYDDQIIQLRSNVRDAAEVKAENGTISIQELVREIDAEELAKENKILHEIDLLLSIYNHKYITNN